MQRDHACARGDLAIGADATDVVRIAQSVHRDAVLLRGLDRPFDRLVRDHLAVVCPAGHALAGRARLRWADLDGHPVITVRPGYGVRPLIDASAARAGVRLRVVHEVTFLSTALWMTRAGMAIAIMPAAYARAARPDELVVLPLTGPRVSRDICIVTKRGRALSISGQALVKEIRAALKG